MRNLTSFIVMSVCGFVLVSCGSPQAVEPEVDREEAAMDREEAAMIARCDRYVQYLECSMEKLETQEERASAEGIIDQVKAVINDGNLPKANQVCESAINTLEQNIELAEKNGCTL